ncbi:MAG TPA: galactokinase [Gemmatimonadaceae bacterium]|nr:galactokinase [Gemmatimonadaceae bacterium]
MTPRDEFEQRYGGTCELAFAPGRVNLIGEHTDYNEGFVLPMAIHLGVRVAFRRRDDNVLRAWSRSFDEECSTDIRELRSVDRASWFAYVAGAIEASGLSHGCDLVIDSDVPVGAGLSSSAALELAVLRAAAAMMHTQWNALDAARTAQRVENEFVGTPCGVMDQMVAALANEGSALLIDCRSFNARPVAIPDDLAIVVLDTGVRRKLASTEFADRRAACERAAAALGLRALRDATLDQLERSSTSLEATDMRRARHVVAENARVLEFANAIERGDVARAGEMMNASHVSLRDLYEVSGPALDRAVEIARAHAACLGARMTGGGFGGCAVALVRAGDADGFVRDVAAALRREHAGAGAFAARPCGGARLVATQAT